MLLGGPVERLRRRRSPPGRRVALGREQRVPERVERRPQHVVVGLEREQVVARGEEPPQLLGAEVVDTELLLRVGRHDAHPLRGARVDLVVLGAGCVELDDRLPEAAELHQVGPVVGEHHLAQVVRVDAELRREVGDRQPVGVQLEDAERPRQRRQPLRVAGQLAHRVPTIARSSASISSRTSSGATTRTRVPSS